MGPAAHPPLGLCAAVSLHATPPMHNTKSAMCQSSPVHRNVLGQGGGSGIRPGFVRVSGSSLPLFCCGSRDALFGLSFLGLHMPFMGSCLPFRMGASCGLSPGVSAGQLGPILSQAFLPRVFHFPCAPSGTILYDDEPHLDPEMGGPNGPKMPQMALPFLTPCGVSDFWQSGL